MGASHKDVERAIRAIIAERQPTKEEQEMIEIMQTSPEKLDPTNILPIQPKKHNKPRYKTLTLEETQALMRASKAPIVHEASTLVDYPTYSQEEVQILMEEYLSRKKEKK